MKAFLTVIAGGFLLAGCCTHRHAHAIQWEYKVAYPPIPKERGLKRPDEEAFINAVANDGWIFIQQDAGGDFIFKRAKK